ncbi:SRPBCC family protein [Naasia lichenicola]|nr:SRPBCC domain-containing protein [Naasia lichenicola]
MNIVDPSSVPDSVPGDHSDREVFLSRAFDAPREVVFRFFSEPALLARWFGPHGVSVPFDSVAVEPRVGGRYELSMADADGAHAFHGVLTEYDPPEALAMTIHADTGIGVLERISLRIQFHDHGDRTRITLRQGPFDPTAKRLTEDGWVESFEKLDLALPSLP